MRQGPGILVRTFFAGFCGPGPAWKYSRERYRVCFDAYGNSCTEWQTYNYSSCGC